ncbi:hypothetical protein ACRAWD_00785 [Caulobacter segnis]
MLRQRLQGSAGRLVRPAGHRGRQPDHRQPGRRHRPRRPRHRRRLPQCPAPPTARSVPRGMTASARKARSLLAMPRPTENLRTISPDCFVTGDFGDGFW